MFKILRKYPIVSYYISKVFNYFLTIFGALTITFFMFRLIPANPVENWIRSLEKTYSVKIDGGEAMVQAYRDKFGMTGSLWEQYYKYMYQVLVHFDLGPSFINFPTPVIDLMKAAIPWTVGLLSVSIIISWTLGLVIGSMAAWFRDTSLSGLITNVSISLSQIPSYLIALFLVLFIGYQWKLLPTRGAFDAQYQIGFSWNFIKSVVTHALLPALAIIIVSLSGWILSTRSLVVGNMGEDYLLYAEAKGIKPRKVMIGYALRNAMLPQATGLALTMGSMMSGQLLIENMFVFPGLGQVMGRAVAIFDYNTMMGIIILSVVSVMTASLVVDLLLPAIDPRVRTAIKA